jgi:hypothetical protein
MIVSENEKCGSANAIDDKARDCKADLLFIAHKLIFKSLFISVVAIIAIKFSFYET